MSFASHKTLTYCPQYKKPPSANLQTFQNDKKHKQNNLIFRYKLEVILCKNYSILNFLSILDCVPVQFRSSKNQHFTTTMAKRQVDMHGVFCPMTTPFDQSGNLDLGSLAKNIQQTNQHDFKGNKILETILIKIIMIGKRNLKFRF